MEMEVLLWCSSSPFPGFSCFPGRAPVPHRVPWCSSQPSVHPSCSSGCAASSQFLSWGHLWVFPGPFCCSGLGNAALRCSRRCSQQGVSVCLSVPCLLPFPTAPFLAGEELLSSGHLHLGNLIRQIFFWGLNCSALSDVPLISSRAPQTAGLSQGSVSCCHRAFCCRAADIALMGRVI